MSQGKFGGRKHSKRQKKNVRNTLKTSATSPECAAARPLGVQNNAEKHYYVYIRERRVRFREEKKKAFCNYSLLGLRKRLNFSAQIHLKINI